MVLTPLTVALSKLLYCEPKHLQEFLNNPITKNSVEEYLKGKKLFTTYCDKQGEKKEVKFGGITLKSAAELYAFEGFLGNK
jgi:hypothetical protein